MHLTFRHSFREYITTMNCRLTICFQSVNIYIHRHTSTTSVLRTIYTRIHNRYMTINYVKFHLYETGAQVRSIAFYQNKIFSTLYTTGDCQCVPANEFIHAILSMIINSIVNFNFKDTNHEAYVPFQNKQLFVFQENCHCPKYEWCIEKRYGTC